MPGVPGPILLVPPASTILVFIGLLIECLLDIGVLVGRLAPGAVRTGVSKPFDKPGGPLGGANEGGGPCKKCE